VRSSESQTGDLGGGNRISLAPRERALGSALDTAPGCLRVLENLTFEGQKLQDKHTAPCCVYCTHLAAVKVSVPPQTLFPIPSLVLLSGRC